MIFRLQGTFYSRILIITTVWCTTVLPASTLRVLRSITSDSNATENHELPYLERQDVSLQPASVLSSPAVTTERLQGQSGENIGNCKLQFGHSLEHDYKFECDNPSNHPEICTYIMKVGITKKPENTSYAEAESFLKKKAAQGGADSSFTSILQTTGEEIWSVERKKEMQLKVPPRTKLILNQVVGTCGLAYEIRTSNTNIRVFALTSSVALVAPTPAAAPAAYYPSVVEHLENVAEPTSQESIEWRGSQEFDFDSSNSIENHPITFTETRPKNDDKTNKKLGFDCENWDSGCDRTKKERTMPPPLQSVYPRSGKMKMQLLPKGVSTAAINTSVVSQPITFVFTFVSIYICSFCS